jgi:transposase
LKYKGINQIFSIKNTYINKIFFAAMGTFHLEKKEKDGGVERTGKNITSRIIEPPNSGRFSENN